MSDSGGGGGPTALKTPRLSQPRVPALLQPSRTSARAVAKPLGGDQPRAAGGAQRPRGTPRCPPRQRMRRGQCSHKQGPPQPEEHSGNTARSAAPPRQSKRRGHCGDMLPIRRPFARRGEVPQTRQRYTPSHLGVPRRPSK
ncbi:hypothetical protein NDU88_006530 [Pleurodeles waltl]|uniref:Uncharacterized protein n=1 Tax=Pleurodeles waltl TaxID=8319 RepID=A0AAV7U0Q8_PLEWA|nr:hypothetical protein NDU88_006530 [Pleurodeles waltl]